MIMLIQGGRSELRDLVNGSFKESFNALVTSDGNVTTMTISNAASPGDNLTMQFSDGNFTLDISGNGTIVLTGTSDSAPTSNYVFITKENRILEVNQSGFPTTEEHIKVGFFLCPTATYTAADGIYINQNWNDPLKGTDDMGHLLHIAERSRRNGAYYFSGVDPAGTDDSTNTSYFDYVNGTEAYFKSSAGMIYQMHRHPMLAKDTRVGSDDIHVVNERSSGLGGNGAFWDIHNLTDIDEDAIGGTLNNKFFNLTFWGVGNKTGEYSPIMCNLPTGSYNNQSNAEADLDGNDVLTMPREFNLESSTGFLICRMTFKNTNGNWSHKSTVDLRGQTPQTATGGAAGSLHNFADNQFTVFDEATPTKIMDFDVGTLVTAGNTRTLQVPNASGVIFLANGAVAMSGTLDMADNPITADQINFTTSEADLQIEKEYITFNLNDTGDRGFYGIYMETYISGAGWAQPIYIYTGGQAGANGAIIPIGIENDLDDGFSGDYFGMTISSKDYDTGGASDIHVGIEVRMGKEQPNDRDINLIMLQNWGSEIVENGIVFIAGATITNGIDLSQATLTNAIKMGNAQTIYDGTTSLSFANLKTSYDYSQIGHLPLGGGVMSGGINMDGNTITGGGAGHDQFSDFVSNEHIDWTNASDNLTTTGYGSFDEIIITKPTSNYTFTSTPIGGTLGLTSPAAQIRFGIYHATGDNTNTVVLDIYGGGNVGSRSGEHRLTMGFPANGSAYVINVNGAAGQRRNLVIGTHTYTDQIELLDNGRINFNTASVSFVSGDVTIEEDLSVNGSVINFVNLPTEDPGDEGDLWNDGGILKISAG